MTNELRARWLLPEYIEDILPVQARRIEALRRGILDLLRVHGYQLVMPPLLEYLDSLLTGTGRDLDLKTFKLVDQLSGRLLGVRADITPQAARIDAHLLNRKGITRLCYCGSVLHTRPFGFNRTREPLQIGAELYGHSGIESDVEIQRMALQSLKIAGIEHVSLDLGNVGIFRSLVQRAQATPELEADLFQAMQNRDVSALREVAAPLDATTRGALEVLSQLYGGAEVLAEAEQCLPQHPEIRQALADLRAVSGRLRDVAEIRCFDLAELRGYRYHSGVVFSAYANGATNALAQGGRYDEIGRAFGRSRPATGFSMDLRELVAVNPPADRLCAVLAPYRPDDAALTALIEKLRADNEVVIVDLPGGGNDECSDDEFACDRELRLIDGGWQVVARKR
jgi:ATP phosphoribosyltransferase regulatory subunit